MKSFDLRAILESETPQEAHDKAVRQRRVAHKAQRFWQAASAVGWSNAELATRLGTDDRLIRRFYSGNPRYEVPDPVLAWLERLAEFVITNPPPALNSPNKP